MDPEDIAAEVETWLAEGFRTLKVKVGKDVEADLTRIQAIQKAVAGRATLRLHANSPSRADQGRAFASRPAVNRYETFAQPCAQEVREPTAAVAPRTAVLTMPDDTPCLTAEYHTHPT